eukprot:CAMPEP_0174727460 /NCGR_PEP_ID=MMETSP1094-20130205/49821_1 /TAXON_ID=156173 /ORGANISM="Chrysochromulina brevifilum, Strain UTEX LB 985" /LENGTH=96 /DNA_ID=CAMNT_0015929205 /DNA_START=877 /DNA_END=1168 /DNA_ORIENTATION=-
MNGLVVTLSSERPEKQAGLASAWLMGYVSSTAADDGVSRTSGNVPDSSTPKGWWGSERLESLNSLASDLCESFVRVPHHAVPSRREASFRAAQYEL